MTRMATPGRNSSDEPQGKTKALGQRPFLALQHAFHGIAAHAEAGDGGNHTDFHQQRDQIFLHAFRSRRVTPHYNEGESAFRRCYIHLFHGFSRKFRTASGRRSRFSDRVWCRSGSMASRAEPAAETRYAWKKPSF